MYHKPELWRTADDKQFEVIARYVPNEDNDTWVEYKNTRTGQTYTCRFEAFQTRFTPVVN